jgi:branched-chain amino acid transport system permease protein
MSMPPTLAQMFRNRRTLTGAVLLLLAVAWVIFSLTTADQRQQVATGLGTGAAIAGIALVVVLNHRGSGVVNFAAGSMASYFAYVYLGLRSQGQLMILPLPNPLAPIEGIAHEFGFGLKLPHWPTMITLDHGHPLNAPASMLITLAMAALFGWLIHVLVFRPLRNASELARAVASIGLLLLFPAITALRFGDGPQQVNSVLPTSYVHVAGISVPQSYLEVAAIVIATAAALWAFLRFTKFGLAMVASAEREKAVVLLGHSPNRLAAVNWIVATLISALLGILVAPITGLGPTTLVFLVVPAVAAAMLGGMSSFAITAVAGLGIGVFQALLAYYGAQSWFPTYGTGPAAIPFPGIFDIFVLLVILATLMFRSGALPARGTVGALRLPKSVTPRHFLPRTAVGTAMALIAMLTLPADWRLGLINSIIGVLLALSVVILTGFAGQVSVAQLSIAGVAAFVMAKIAANWGLAFPVGPLIGIVCAAAFSFVCSIPALRIRGVNLAIVTLAIVEVVQNFVFQIATDGGAQGGVSVGPPRFLGVKFGPNDPTGFRALGDSAAGLVPNPLFGVFCLIVVVVVILLTYWLRRSRAGLRLLAVRSDERASATSGLSVTRTKVLAFVASAIVAGVAGVLSAYRFGTVTPDYFGGSQALLFFAFAYMGGIGGVGGALWAGFLIPDGIGTIVGSQWFGVPPVFTTLIGGVGLVLTVVLEPDGIAPPTIEGFERLWGRVSGRLPRAGDGTPSPGMAGQPPGPDGAVTALSAARASGETVPATSSRAEDPA